MKHIYFVNERIRLRAMEPEDLELICEMENDPQQWDISNFTVPYSRYVMKQYMENSQCDMFSDKQLRMMVVRLEDHATIGTIDITDFSSDACTRRSGYRYPERVSWCRLCKRCIDTTL